MNKSSQRIERWMVYGWMFYSVGPFLWGLTGIILVRGNYWDLSTILLSFTIAIGLFNILALWPSTLPWRPRCLVGQHLWEITGEEVDYSHTFQTDAGFSYPYFNLQRCFARGCLATNREGPWYGITVDRVLGALPRYPTDGKSGDQVLHE